MFTIKLLQANGSDKGTRHHVDASPFVIGRGSGCGMMVTSRTISRRHCMIVFDDSGVWIRDLGSHNGTAVNGDRVKPETPHRLSHHDHIQIGKYVFRVSIRNTKTGEPYQPEFYEQSTVSGAVLDPGPGAPNTAKLLSELDDLASNLDGHSGGSATTARPPWQAESEAASPNPSASVPAGSDSDSEEESEDTTVFLGSELAADDDGSADQPANGSKQPGRLPEHLRPKAPKNSRNAAAEALKNLWEGR